MFGEIPFRVFGGLTWLCVTRCWRCGLESSTQPLWHVIIHFPWSRIAMKKISSKENSSLMHWLSETTATGSLCRCYVRLNVMYESSGPDKWAVNSALRFSVRGLMSWIWRARRSYVHSFWSYSYKRKMWQNTRTHLYALKYLRTAARSLRKYLSFNYYDVLSFYKLNG